MRLRAYPKLKGRLSVLSFLLEVVLFYLSMKILLFIYIIPGTVFFAVFVSVSERLGRFSMNRASITCGGFRMIKLIAADLDGTLLARHRGLSDRTKEALKIAARHGCHFVAATGRDFYGVRGIFEGIGIPYSAILGNGAQYYSSDGQLIYHAYMNPDVLKDVLDIFIRLNIYLMIYTSDGFYSIEDPEIVCEAFIVRGVHKFQGDITESRIRMKENHMPCTQLVEITDLDAWLKAGHEIIKVEAFDLDESKIDRAKEELKNIPGIAYLSSFTDNVEVTDFVAQKGTMLKRVATDMGLSDEEVAVFGDGMNDLTLFTEFSNSYAVANAVPEIQAIASHKIPSCDEDGVAQTIEFLFLDR